MGSSFFRSKMGVLPYLWFPKWGPHLPGGRFPPPSAPLFLVPIFLFYLCPPAPSGVRAYGWGFSLIHRLLLLGWVTGRLATTTFPAPVSDGRWVLPSVRTSAGKGVLRLAAQDKVHAGALDSMLACFL